MMLVFQSLTCFSPSWCRHQGHQALTWGAVNKDVRSRIVSTPVACGDFCARHSKPSFRTERGASPGRVGFSVRNTGLEPAHPAVAGAGLGSLMAVLATALASSLRRMRRKVTGTAHRPIQPQAQNAQGKPPVEAAAGGAPWGRRVVKRRGAFAGRARAPAA